MANVFEEMRLFEGGEKKITKTHFLIIIIREENTASDAIYFVCYADSRAMCQ